MSGLKDSLGIQTTTKVGEIYFYASFVCTCMVVADIFNIFDGVGLIKKTGHKILPSLFGEDKFRPAATTKTPPLI